MAGVHVEFQYFVWHGLTSLGYWLQEKTLHFKYKKQRNIRLQAKERYFYHLNDRKKKDI